MDLGLHGRTALVCAASKGLGRACAMALAREGVNVTITARGVDVLEQTAAEIRSQTGVMVTAIAGDITTGAGRAAALAACPNPDILVNNAGGPPPGDFREWERDDWIKALDGNMLTPDRTDQGDCRWHDRPAVRPDRQHHVGEREIPRSRSWV